MTSEHALSQIKTAKASLDRSIDVLTENDAQLTPAPDMFSVTQQLAHIAQTVDWFMGGAFGSGFNTNMEEHKIEFQKITTLQDAKSWCDQSFKTLIERLEGTSTEALAAPMPEGIMGGEPTSAVIDSIVEHTAHHRGALTVYTRLCGKVPTMPYGE